MIKLARLAVVTSAALASIAAAHAININVHVDAAPNVYGSPDYASWWTATKAAVASGTFVNMASSADPANYGSTDFELEDAVVYSFGDLGKRLHFIYWIAGETIATLTDANFQVRVQYEWDGVSYENYAPDSWVTPTSWEEYSGGVIGSAGFAFWGAHGVNTPEALANDLDSWRPYLGDVTFSARADGGSNAALTASHSVPDSGSTALLLLVGLCGFALRSRRNASRRSSSNG